MQRVCSKYAADIWESGTHLLKLIDSILDLSKIDAGGRTIDCGSITVSPLIEDCVRMVADNACAAGITLAPKLDFVLVVNADRRALQQIVLNLVSNAIKFTQRNGHVRIETAIGQEGCFLLTVADDGIGIKPENLATVLEPFVRVEGAWSRTCEGSGLGLPIAKALAELQGGGLTMNNVEGAGTKVEVRLPAERVLATGGQMPTASN